MSSLTLIGQGGRSRCKESLTDVALLLIFYTYVHSNCKLVGCQWELTSSYLYLMNDTSRLAGKG